MLQADNKEIDAFFATLDADGSGAVDLAEMKPALKALQKQAVAADAEKARLLKKSEGLQERIDAVLKVAALTEAVEKEAAALKQAQEQPSAAARIGAMLIKKNVKVGGGQQHPVHGHVQPAQPTCVARVGGRCGGHPVRACRTRAHPAHPCMCALRMQVGDVASTWDKDGDGKVSRAEFKGYITGEKGLGMKELEGLEVGARATTHSLTVPSTVVHTTQRSPCTAPNRLSAQRITEAAALRTCCTDRGALRHARRGGRRRARHR